MSELSSSDTSSAIPQSHGCPLCGSFMEKVSQFTHRRQEDVLGCRPCNTNFVTVIDDEGQRYEKVYDVAPLTPPLYWQ